jgi:hypothetical protein
MSASRRDPDLSYRVGSIDDLPDDVQAGFRRSLAPHEAPLHVFSVRARQDGPRRPLEESRGRSFLALTHEQAVLVHHPKTGPEVEVEAIPLGSLAYFEAGSNSAYSWLSLVPDATFKRQEVVFEYAPVVRELFQEEFRRTVLHLRALTLNLDLGMPGITTGMSGSGLLQALPRRFETLSRRYWLIGESALGATFIPAVAVPVLRVFKRAYSFRTAVVLTDKQVLVVAEQPDTSADVRHGAAHRFLPLSRLQRVSVDRSERYSEVGVLRLFVGGWHSTTVVSVPFPLSLESEMRGLAAEITATNSRARVVDYQEIA